MSDEFLATLPSPIGTLLLRARGNRLVGITILAGGDPRPSAVASGSGRPPVLVAASAQLKEYFAGRRREFDLPLDLSGLPPFTRRVLEFLRTVPCGATVTYAALAQRAGSPRGARAVGRAMAANPLPIVIPCHRVVAAAGGLGGYSGGEGVPTKEWLLAFEQRHGR